MSDTINDDEEPLDPPDGPGGGSGTETGVNPTSTDPQPLPLDPPEGSGGGG